MRTFEEAVTSFRLYGPTSVKEDFTFTYRWGMLEHALMLGLVVQGIQM